MKGTLKMNILKISNSFDNSVRYFRNYDGIYFSLIEPGIFEDHYKVYVHILSGSETAEISKTYKVKEEAEVALNKLKSDYEKFCLSCEENKIFTLTM